MQVKLKVGKAVLEQLSKEEMGELLGRNEKDVLKMKKAELFKELKKNVGSNKDYLREIHLKFASKFSMHPTDVEDLLGITKTERQHWTEDGKLKVATYGMFTKWGKNIKYPRYDFLHTHSVTPSKLESWRTQREKEKKRNRKKAIKKAQITKKKNEDLQKQFFDEEWPKMLERWYQMDEGLGVSLQLSFWTMWISRWAKEMQLKSRRARAKKKEYIEIKDKFYEYKNESIANLIESPYSEVAFYRPDNPDRITYLEFCPKHFDWWLREREFDYVPKWEFYAFNQKAIHKCESCTVNIEKDYYSLFYIKVAHEELEDYSFSFHTPYPLGKYFFPSIAEMKKVNHQEQEGLFRFGRSLFDEEKSIFRVNEVEEQFDKAMTKYKDKMAKKEVHL